MSLLTSFIDFLIVVSCFANVLLNNDDPNIYYKIIEFPISTSFTIGLNGLFYSFGAIFVAELFPPFTGLLILVLLNISNYSFYKNMV